MNYSEDKRVVVTLDAGGTNFVFSAIQGNQEAIKPIHLPAVPDDLSRCLSTITDGFQEVIAQSATACGYQFRFSRAGRLP